MVKQEAKKPDSFAGWLKAHEDWISFTLGILALIVIVVGGIWYLWGKLDGKKLIVSKLNQVGQQASESGQASSTQTDKEQSGETKEKALVQKQTPPAKGQVYVVKTGDSLWKIAQAAYNDGYRWLDIAKANKLSNPDVLLVGQKLYLPGTKPADLAAEVVYQVKRGDTLFLLSQRFYSDGYLYPQVAEYNQITNPDLIEVGQKIKFPPKAKLKPKTS